ncbi:hypothetical protein EIP91_003078 [Steccherinum ochraceum]|uniref:NAD(P)-binding protein n=1 Tax=Steccherinum ochraceum TaxID=92696 RepID=A0A4R0RRM3_9APHY|nr:hypothetical protein EIP91_003078 [Steccherinum ochraceum]
MDGADAKKYVGKAALVTGAASGIGRSLAIHLVKNGARVICCDVNSTAGQAVVDMLNKSLGSTVAHFVKVNVSSWEEVSAAFTTAEEVLRTHVDFVFANAGILGGKVCFPDEGRKPSTRMMEINFFGVMYTIQAAINHFRKHQCRGSVVATASIAGMYPLRPDPVYAASKHAVVGLIRSAAMRTEKEKIYINAIAPAATESGMVGKSTIKEMNALGLATSMQNIMNAFDTFLTPECRLFGQIAEPIGSSVNLIGYPLPGTLLCMLKRREEEESERGSED